MRRFCGSTRDCGRSERTFIVRLEAAGPILLWIVALGYTAGAPDQPAMTPTAAASEPTTVCASQILVRYWGAEGASVVRTSGEALAIARKALAKGLEPGGDFEAICREFAKAYPDVTAGRTGPFSRGTMVKEFADTVFALGPGQVADWITTTAYGYHVIRRNPTVHCRHILIAYKGASRATVTRTKEEARKQAEDVRQEALRPGVDFAALARRDSDVPDGTRGGDVGVFDEGMMVAAFEKAAFALQVHQVSPVVETRFGFHIIQRIE